MGRMRREAAEARREAELLAELRRLGSERNRAGMARHGIDVEAAFGVSVYVLRGIARQIGTTTSSAPGR